MRKFQIRFCDSKGCGSFTYFEANQNIENRAARHATEYIAHQKRKVRTFSIFSQPFKPKRIVHVWEWDTANGRPKRKGYRFKLLLMFIELTNIRGDKRRTEWYEPIKNS